MAGYFPRDTFTDAFKEAHSYPSQGKRSRNNGVPARPTLARYAATEVLGSDPFGSPIRSNTKTVLGVVVKLADDAGEPLSSVIASQSSKTELKHEAKRAITERYPGSTAVLPDNAFSHINHTSAIIAATCAVSYDVDPVAAVRANLDGVTRYNNEIN